METLLLSAEVRRKMAPHNQQEISGGRAGVLGDGGELGFEQAESSERTARNHT